MERNSKPIKKYKVKKKRDKRPPRKFKCELCERMVIRHEEIKTRKNYPHGRKSKPSIVHIHRKDEGILIELKKKRKEW